MKVKHAYEIQNALETAQASDNVDLAERMQQEEWVRVEDILKAMWKSSRHDMHPSVCKDCDESHHYLACHYDFLMALDETGKLNKMFEASLHKDSTEPSK